MSHHAKLIKGGKVVIPADLRREFGFKDGDTLVFERGNDGLVIKTYAQVVREVQAQFKAMLGDNAGSMVDELIAERRAEARAETLAEALAISGRK
jgi:AbrB family transcriptional regulator, stage V sporulation protein T